MTTITPLQLLTADCKECGGLRTTDLQLKLYLKCVQKATCFQQHVFKHDKIALEMGSCVLSTLIHVVPKKIIYVNPLNPELNPICYLLALLGDHHFLHVSRIRVKSLTLR